MLEEEIQIDPVIEKPSRATRIEKSLAARQRRKGIKSIKAVHQMKEEKDAKERLVAKRRLERQKKRSRRKYAPSSQKSSAQG